MGRHVRLLSHPVRVRVRRQWRGDGQRLRRRRRLGQRCRLRQGGLRGPAAVAALRGGQLGDFRPHFRFSVAAEAALEGRGLSGSENGTQIPKWKMFSLRTQKTTFDF